MLSRRVCTQTSAIPRSETPVSAIGISPRDDNVCIVGISSGHVFATTFGAPLLAEVTPSELNNDQGRQSLNHN